MGGGLTPRSEHFQFLQVTSRYARPSTIDTDDTSCMEAIWIGILNVC